MTPEIDIEVLAKAGYEGNSYAHPYLPWEERGESTHRKYARVAAAAARARDDDWRAALERIEGCRFDVNGLRAWLESEYTVGHDGRVVFWSGSAVHTQLARVLAALTGGRAEEGP